MYGWPDIGHAVFSSERRLVPPRFFRFVQGRIGLPECICDGIGSRGGQADADGNRHDPKISVRLVCNFQYLQGIVDGLCAGFRDGSGTAWNNDGEFFAAKSGNKCLITRMQS